MLLKTEWRRLPAEDVVTMVTAIKAFRHIATAHRPLLIDLADIKIGSSALESIAIGCKWGWETA